MKVPFVYGRIADKADFTDRMVEQEQLFQRLSGRVNTVIISPRRWGKTSLVNRVVERLEANDAVRVCQIDIFNCRTEIDFYQAYAASILKKNASAWEEFIASVRKYLGRFLPTVSLSDVAQTYELSFGLDFKDNKLSYDEILDLPQMIAKDTGKQLIICIDEFQNINEYDDSLAFQQRLRSHWQRHTDVCYCLYGSKRHMLLNIFNTYEMPFYKFGDILFLEKIARDEWVKFIQRRFEDTGKHISEELCGVIADRTQNHPYYTQQLSQQVWFRTTSESTLEIVDDAFFNLVAQLSLLFSNLVDTLTPKQINFLLAVADGVTNFSSLETLNRYKLGTSSNIKNLKKVSIEKDLVDILPGNRIELQDPVFEYWLTHVYITD
jgi:AAA+ ATPase superfamily predicted ATPase